MEMERLRQRIPHMRRALVAPDQELTREFFEHLVNLGPGPGRACLVFRGEQILDDLIDKQRKVNEELEDLWEVDRYLKALKAERGMLDTEVRNIARILDEFCEDEEKGEDPGEQDSVLAAAEAAPSGEYPKERLLGVDIQVSANLGIADLSNATQSDMRVCPVPPLNMSLVHAVARQIQALSQGPPRSTTPSLTLSQGTSCSTTSAQSSSSFPGSSDASEDESSTAPSCGTQRDLQDINPAAEYSNIKAAYDSISIEAFAESAWSPREPSQHIYPQPIARPVPLKRTLIQPAAFDPICEECKVAGCTADEPPTQSSHQPKPCQEPKTKTSFLVPANLGVADMSNATQSDMRVCPVQPLNMSLVHARQIQALSQGPPRSTTPSLTLSQGTSCSTASAESSSSFPGSSDASEDESSTAPSCGTQRDLQDINPAAEDSNTKAAYESISIEAFAESAWSPPKQSASGGTTSQHTYLQPITRPVPLKRTPIQSAASDPICEDCKVAGCTVDEPPNQSSHQPNLCQEPKTKTSFLVSANVGFADMSNATQSDMRVCPVPPLDMSLIHARQIQALSQGTPRSTTSSLTLSQGTSHSTTSSSEASEDEFSTASSCDTQRDLQDINPAAEYSNIKAAYDSISIEAFAESAWSPRKLSLSGGTTSQHIYPQPIARPVPLKRTTNQPAASDPNYEECKVGGCTADEPPAHTSHQPNPRQEPKTKTSFLGKVKKGWLKMCCFGAGCCKTQF